MLRVAILGSSGMVSQRLQEMLANHPWFDLVAICGSKPGMKISEIPWKLETAKPELPIESVSDFTELEVDLAFSALPSQVAQVVEPDLVERGIAVFSNSSTFRMQVPLVIPEINPEALKQFSGHACATNCTVIPVVMPLAAMKNLGIEKVRVKTEQALSGGGWELVKSGLKSKEIPGEAEKMVEEARELLGLPDLDIEVECERVARIDGHVVHVEVEFENSTSLQSVEERLNGFNGLRLPSSPKHVIQISNPDPVVHLWAGKGMTTTVGNIVVENDRLRYSALSHNTVRGAAGGVILLAELAFSEGLLAPHP